MQTAPLDHQSLRTILEQSGLRCTPQRLAVYDHLTRALEHPTAEEVFLAVRADLPRISLATVYKALEALVETGVAAKLPPLAGDAGARYDARRDPHYHFRCLRTGTVHDLPTRFDPELIARLDPQLADYLGRQGFRVTGYRLELLGYEAEGTRGMNAGPPLEPLSPLVDTHAHLDDDRLLADRDGVLSRARDAGVVQVVTIGTTAADSARVVELARSRPGLFAAVGIHPNESAQAGDSDWSAIRALADRPEVVAIGETGLDRYWDRTPFPTQQEWFARHLELARQLDRTVVIHGPRDCAADLIDQLRALGRPVRGVQHSFTGTWDDARAFLDLGLHLSFAGMLTYTNRSLDALREVAARVPLDRILVETDSPYLSPHPFRGQSNEPARVAVTARRLAELRGIPPAELARITTENARRLFRLPDTAILQGFAASGRPDSSSR